MRTLVLTLSVAFLTACGGGGGGSTPTPARNPDPINYTLYDTSYKNFKSYPFDSFVFPASTQWGETLGVGVGNFLDRNTASVFTTTQNYVMNGTVSAAQSTDSQYKSDFRFWTINPDRSLTLAKSYKGCLHPRKAVVADFNRDGISDVFVACHGYDGAPYPGEKSKLLLSNGTDFTMSDVGDVGFYHGASAADVNNDGYPDIVVANIQNTPSVYFLMNQGNGTFVKDTTRVTDPNPGGIFSVELLDVNQDNIIDLVIGGHEHEGFAAKIMYGDINGVFGNTSYTIPSVPGSGVVLDFTLVDVNKLYVGRAYDSTSSAGFYGGYTLQVVDLHTQTSTIAASGTGSWIPWFVLKTKDNKNGVAPYLKLFDYFFTL
jgi:hypothetical protein